MIRYGETKRPDISYQLRPGAYAILPRDGQLLLTFQGADQNELQLPGGGIDAGESPTAALHREVAEETGWRIAAPRLLGMFRRFVFMPEYDKWAEKVCHIYVARPVRRLHEPTEPHHTALWAQGDVAVKLLGNEGDRATLARFLRIKFNK